MTTFRTIKVTGDWLPDGASFEAKVAVDASGEYDLWNGFVSDPLFTFAEAHRLGAAIDAANQGYTDFDRIVAVEDSDGFRSVTMIPRPELLDEGEDIQRPQPEDVEGEVRWNLGLAWTWCETEGAPIA